MTQKNVVIFTKLSAIHIAYNTRLIEEKKKEISTFFSTIIYYSRHKMHLAWDHESLQKLPNRHPLCL